MSDNALAQCVDLELADRSGVEIACAYRALCCSLLLRTAMVARAKCPPRKQDVDQKRTAAEWVGGGRGVITFEEACQVLDIVPEQARGAIGRYAGSRATGPINTVRPRSKTTFSRKHRYVPRPADVAVREVPPTDGLDASTPDASNHRGDTAWPRPSSPGSQAP